MMNYSKETPFYASISDRYRLTHVNSTKETWHLSIDVSGSDMVYKPGDSLGVLPKNSISHVNRLLRYFQKPAEYLIVDPRSQQVYKLIDWLQERVDLSSVSEKLFEGVLSHGRLSTSERDRLKEVSEKHNASLEGPDKREKLWCKGFDIPLFFEKFIPLGVDFSEILQFFTPLTPRYYSIASSPFISEKMIDLLISHVSYTTVHGIQRVGITSHYLIQDAVIGSKEVRVFLHPTQHFTLPDEVITGQKPLIMIGPGTGIAPFRGFLQHIETIQTAVKEKNISSRLWLIFGERNEEYDFLYREYWSSLCNRDIITFDAVFSRDGDQKEYVQDRMWRRRKEIFDWIYRKEGYFYVCGDAKKMAKDVETMLIAIIQSEGSLDQAAGDAWIKNFRKSGRYRRDVY